MHMVDIKLFAKMGNPHTVRIWDGSWHKKMCHANNEKRKMTNDRKNRTTKSRKHTHSHTHTEKKETY